MIAQRDCFEPEHSLFRESVRAFIDSELVPHSQEWDRSGIVDRGMFKSAAARGFIGMDVPEEYGGGGQADFRYHQILAEEIQYAGISAVGLGLQVINDICLPYISQVANETQKQRWLPGVINGDVVLAIAMTEPRAGSDLAGMASSAVRNGDHYIVNGAKTFISNGINADLIITAVKTDPTSRHRGISLVIVENGFVGFHRGRRLDKLGLAAQDTAELFFDDVPVPVTNLLGEEGQGFHYMMQQLPRERLSIAMTAVAGARRALEWTLDYVKTREAFGRNLSEFQNTRFRLAEIHTEIEIAQVFVDRCVTKLNSGTLAAEDAAMAKWWCTELQNRSTDTCLQLHGGYGYMLEYPIAKAFVDARAATIYGGTTEIMKEVIGRSLGL